jgi:hypothetical protein
MERAPAATRREADTAPERAPAVPAGGSLGPASVLALQRTAGNAAVTALLAREPAAIAEKTPIQQLREILKNGDEDAAIAQLAALSRDDGTVALGMKDLRDLAVKAFDDGRWRAPSPA